MVVGVDWDDTQRSIVLNRLRRDIKPNGLRVCCHRRSFVVECHVSPYTVMELNIRMEFMLRDAFGKTVAQLTPEIGRWPRRKPGEILVAGTFLKYADMHSFYYQTRQIFGDGLYRFTCAPVILDCGAHIGSASLFFKGDCRWRENPCV